MREWKLTLDDGGEAIGWYVSHEDVPAWVDGKRVVRADPSRGLELGKWQREWEKAKEGGSGHYKTEGVEPIDLMRDGGIFRAWAIGEIIQHAFRNRDVGEPVRKSDMEKIRHYAELLMAGGGE